MQAMDVVKWTFLTKRPLTVIELCHALSVTIDPDQLQPGNMQLAYDEKLEWDNFPSQKSLIDWCFGLLIIDDETSTVRLVHKSLHDYLTLLHDKGEIFSNGHSELAYTCLQYMSFNDDEHHMDMLQPGIPRKILYRQRQLRFRLLDYATNYLGLHLDDQSSCTADMIHGLFPDRMNLNFISTGSRSGFLSPFSICPDLHEYNKPAQQIHLAYSLPSTMCWRMFSRISSMPHRVKTLIWIPI
jgi:hypothetical protein